MSLVDPYVTRGREPAGGRRARGASGTTRGTRRPAASKETFESRLPNLRRYGRDLAASNLGVAEFTTVILYGSRRLICRLLLTT